MRRRVALALACVCCAGQAAALGQAAAEPSEAGATAEYGPIYWAMERLTARMRRATAVTLYVSNPNWWPNRLLDEARLKQAACAYQTTDAAVIADLVSAIEAANVRATTSAAPLFEPREAIYLTLGGGGQIRLLFDKVYSGQPLQGRVDGKPVTADNALVEALYRWAATLSPVDQCEPFVGKYRDAPHAVRGISP